MSLENWVLCLTPPQELCLAFGKSLIFPVSLMFLWKLSVKIMCLYKLETSTETVKASLSDRRKKSRERNDGIGE